MNWWLLGLIPGVLVAIVLIWTGCSPDYNKSPSDEYIDTRGDKKYEEKA